MFHALTLGMNIAHWYSVLRYLSICGYCGETVSMLGKPEVAGPPECVDHNIIICQGCQLHMDVTKIPLSLVL